MATKEDQKYFVSVEVKWGKEDENGKQKAESVGGQNWGALSYDQSVAVQAAVVIPGVVSMLEEAGVLGLETVDMLGLADPALTTQLKEKVRGK